jgi:hypothetical protein
VPIAVINRWTTTTVPGTVGRTDLVGGTYEPDNTSATTGVLPGVSRSNNAGDITLTGGQTIQNLNITGRVICNVANASIKNCLILGDATVVTDHGVVQTSGSSASNLLIEDTSIVPGTPSKWENGIYGHDFTARRCLIRNVVDGIRISNAASPTGATNVVVEQCWIGDHSWFTPAPFQSDGSHCDCIQMEGGSGTVIRYNSLNSFVDPTVSNSPYSRRSEPSPGPYRALSCIMITPNVGAITAISMTKNWCRGGEIQVNGGSDANAGKALGTWTSNRFGRSSYFAGHTIDFQSGATFTATGNVYDDDGTAVTVRTNA